MYIIQVYTLHPSYLQNTSRGLGENEHDHTITEVIVNMLSFQCPRNGTLLLMQLIFLLLRGLSNQSHLLT